MAMSSVSGQYDQRHIDGKRSEGGAASHRSHSDGFLEPTRRGFCIGGVVASMDRRCGLWACSSKKENSGTRLILGTVHGDEGRLQFKLPGSSNCNNPQHLIPLYSLCPGSPCQRCPLSTTSTEPPCELDLRYQLPRQQQPSRIIFESKQVDALASSQRSY
jgi:hypothetical protein